MSHSRHLSKNTEQQELIREEKDLYINDSMVQGLSANNFLRTSSAKVFLRSNDKNNEQEEKYLIKNMT